jgi:D-cysteine desulfhydrase
MTEDSPLSDRELEILRLVSTGASNKEIAAQLPETAYVIPEGGSNEIGAWGYIRAFNEIMEQDPSIDTIVSASGSGGTHAGLLLGKLLNKSPVHVLSVNVCDDETYFQNKIDSIMQRFCIRYGHSLSWQKEDIHILDGFVGPGYAQIGSTEAALIKRFAQGEGIVLDPVYTAKAMLGLEQNLRRNTIPGRKILFIHTGGIFGTFAFSEMF